MCNLLAFARVHFLSRLVQHSPGPTGRSVRVETPRMVEIPKRVPIAAKRELVRAEAEPRLGVLGLKVNGVPVAPQRPADVAARLLGERQRPEWLDRRAG